MARVRRAPSRGSAQDAPLADIVIALRRRQPVAVPQGTRASASPGVLLVLDRLAERAGRRGLSWTEEGLE